MIGATSGWMVAQRELGAARGAAARQRGERRRGEGEGAGSGHGTTPVGQYGSSGVGVGGGTLPPPGAGAPPKRPPALRRKYAGGLRRPLRRTGGEARRAHAG